MNDNKKTAITVRAHVQAPLEKVWRYWSEPKHIIKWCNASADWHAPKAENDLREGGKFLTTMAAKDGSVSFDFEGMYTSLQHHKLIEYQLADGRMVSIHFAITDSGVQVTEVFEAENENPVDLQRDGWQAILDNFKKYTETT